MAMQFHAHCERSIESAEKTLNAAFYQLNQPPVADAAQKPKPFVTVSREPGAGAIRFSHRLADRLNRDGRGQWSAWDRELVEKVSADHGIAREIIQMIPNRRYNWLSDFLDSVAISHTPTGVAEARAYQRVMVCIRALASAGHAIIVGRGGVFVTHQMPGGIHLRLVAPLQYRIHHLAEREHITPEQAAAAIREAQEQQSAFYRHYWPGRRLEPETFTLTLNTAELSTDQLVDSVLPVIRAREAELRPGAYEKACAAQAPSH